jgi:hypothetical protein
LNHRVKLSIAIPIYKRPELLEKSLDSISIGLQSTSYNFDIDIFLIDDSCSDINSYVVNKFIANNNDTQITFVKNVINVGIDENICNALFLPNSDYVWLMGEDDLIHKNSFEILDKYLNNDYDFIAVNYATVNNNYNIMRESNFPNSNNIDLSYNHTVDLSTFLSNYFIYIGFIGSCIYKKSVINKEHYLKYLGSYFSHLSPFLIKRESWKIGVVNDILVYNRAEDFSSFTWKENAFDVMFGMVNLVSNPYTNISSDLKKTLLLSLIEFQEIYKFKRLLSLRAENIFTFKVFKKYYLKDIKINFFNTLNAFVISILPTSPLRLIKNIYKKL